MTTTTTDAQAADAMRAHHFEMATTLRQRVTDLRTAVRSGRPHAEAQRSVLEYLENELLPHAMAEERALYPAGDAGSTAMLVRSMRDEHLNLIGHVDAFRDATDPVDAVALSAAIFALFDSHLHKENDLLVPALLSAPGVSLADLLGGMHELLG
ncbi:MAG TPA: hemerythrin domain-containing protein [Candidatus Limnocylindria bacterium]|nr:hemerythrin domain-containing protein [Candidatus Limnocylindria bacterium]